MRALLYSSALLLAFAIPAAAHAETVNFTFTSSIGTSLSFTLESSAPNASNFGTAEYAVSGTDGSNDVVDFWGTDFNSINGTSDGPIDFEINDRLGNSNSDQFFYGDQLFTGNESDPVFHSGTYTLGPAVPDGGLNETGSLVIAVVPSAVPEPSSLMLFGTGVLGCVGALRRRFLKA